MNPTEFRERIRTSLANEALQIALDGNAERRTTGRIAALASLPDWRERRQQAHAVRAEVIEHLEAPQVSIREAVRVLCSGGRLLVTTPNYRSFWPVMEWAVDRLNMAPKMAGEQHISRFDPSSLRQLLVAAGLAVEYSGSIYHLSPFLSLISAKQAKRQLQRELNRRSGSGMILVAVAIKP